MNYGKFYFSFCYEEGVCEKRQLLSYNNIIMSLINFSICVVACFSGLSCRGCVNLGRVWVQLAENNSLCCYDSMDEVEEPFSYATVDVNDCPLDAAKHQTLAVGK